MEQSTPEWYVLIRAPRCHFPVENPHCLGFLETRTVRPGAPFTVDPPEWYVFNSRFGGRPGVRGLGLGRPSDASWFPAFIPCLLASPTP